MFKHKFVLTLIMLLFIVACTAQGGGTITEDEQGVIFSAEQTADLTYIVTFEGEWTPTIADVEQFDLQLATHLEQNYPELSVKLASYNRQYLGIESPTGEQGIYGNYFCDDHGMISDFNWQNELVDVLDGGDCYFQTFYNLITKQFEWLSTNGEA